MCDCISKMNEALVEHNTKLEIPIMVGGSFELSVSGRVVVATEKIDSRKRTGPMKIFASFCPFCSDRYDVPE